MRRASRRRVSYVITHNKDDHGHLLGINSLALDTTTVNPETGKPEGILYSAGRDGVIASWDLHLPFRDKKTANINGSIHKSTESINEVNDVGVKNWEIDDEVDLYSQTKFDLAGKITNTVYSLSRTHAPGPGWVASGGFDRKIIIWDILSVYALACNPTGTVLASGSPEKVVRLWDPRTTKQITSFTGHTDNIRAILVSDDGELVNSVWSLYSDHPRLELFYSGGKDGLVTKIDYSGCAEIRDGECVAVCKEETGVVKLDVPPRHIRKAISRSSSPSISPTSPQLSPMPPLTIPPSSIINLTSTGVSYGMALDAEVATLYSVTTDDQRLDSLDIEDPIPVRGSPDSIIKEVFKELNTIEYIPTWCEVDTRIGALTVHLDERNCFDAEAYADELNLPEGADIREDQRKFQAQNLLMQQQRHQSNDYRRELQDDRSPPPQNISFPPATIQVPTTPPTVATTHSVNSPSQSTSVLPQSPTTPLAAFTGPLTAPATTGSQQSDYFSGSHHNSPTSPTGASGNVTPPGSTGPETLSGPLTTSEIIKPPPPALLNQTSSKAKPESSGTSMSTEKNADAKTDSTSATSTPSQEEFNAQSKKDEESKANASARSKVQLQHTGDSNRYHPIQHDPIHSIRSMRSFIQPPFVQLPISETPEVPIPPHTTVIISEVSPEASTFVDSYRGTIESMDKDVELIELKAHPWLMEFLLKNKIALKESVKIGFTLKPHEGSELEDLPNG
ncbi:9536_t:CDS:10 [Racocetra fulgida]|uniref:9536_t:CDS:1 n=1 Tax=Racocetra fulgida TaxID=60492 RepID=A0A9N9B2L5_9GLOM|nr:9536_t:CDS:10 [Racocetra fulgida]